MAIEGFRVSAVGEANTVEVEAEKTQIPEEEWFTDTFPPTKFQEIMAVVEGEAVPTELIFRDPQGDNKWVVARD